jgi:hypothetical protein
MTILLALLDNVAALSGWFFALPQSAAYLIYGLLLAYSIAAGGFVLARLGLKPLWSLILIVPTLNLVGLFFCAYSRWPAQNIQTDQSDTKEPSIGA